MKRCFVVVGLLAVGLWGPLHSYVEVLLDGRSSPEVTFSHRAFNRVSYQDGSIKSVVGSKGELDVNLNSGIAFIKPKSLCEGPLTVTIITTDDEAQDLNILVGDKGAEHVRLVDPKEEVDQLLEKISAVNFLNTLIEGNCPQLYQKTTTLSPELFDLPDPLESNYVQSFSGPSETIQIYRITNNSRKKDFILNTALFKSQSNLWVFLSQPHLGPQDSSMCIIAIPKRGVFE